LRWIATSVFVSFSAYRVQPVVNRLARVAVKWVFVLTVGIGSAVKSALSQGCFVGICGTALMYAVAAFAQSSSNGFLSGSHPTSAIDSQSMDQRSGCKTRFTALVRDLDSALASDPEAITPVYEVFHKYFPVEKCKIEDVLAIARVSRFFVGSEEMGTYYNIAFNSAGVSSRPGFAVQISAAKKTGDLELPFAKVNGY
jgi:hypothetical protein